LSGKRAGRLALGGLLGVALLALFLRGVEWPALLAAFRSASAPGLVATVLATLVTYVIRSWRWGYLLAPLAKVPLPRLFSATLVGFMSGLIVPRAGEILRPYLIGRRHGVKTSAAFASIILERLFDLITVVVLFGLYLYVLPTPAQQTRGPLLGVLRGAGALVGLAALGITLVLAMFHAQAARATALVDRLLSVLPPRLARPIGEAVRAFQEGLGVLQAPPRHLLAIAGQSVLTWLTIALGIHFNNRAFGIELPFHTTFLIIGFLTVGVAVPTPGMVGGFHESYRLALTQAFSAAPETAVAAGIALHALTNLPVLILGLAFLPAEGLTFSRVAEITDDKQTPEKEGPP
jgi:uncharacterized protein (TIRG00374 family)